jgi:hypothetical protein
LFFFILTSQVILHDLTYTLYLTYTDLGITRHINSSNSVPDGFKEHQSFFFSFSTSLLTLLYSPSDENHISWSSSL